MNDISQMNPQQAKQFALQTVRQTGIPPDAFVQLGQVAEQVLQDSSLYPEFASAMVSNGLMTPEEIGQGYNYQLITSLIALGRVCQEIAQPQMGAA